ncbi:hypothetical protein PCANC_18700 [Puccinia coronata f. sp. avenae]|uniref:Uncharacterized protein n=1 Tax=Puccinia coronata f. sp. avenae TaxID=200324 RepID=A0A2N5TYV3_9BASI|nr:hypothetical protein PCANC_18700 [Puccinia coronata f. sp. avenae]PLW34260.1 hypothetical protein PCASD_17905 [Puccinia coronata f. sp. avenae]
MSAKSRVEITVLLTLRCSAGMWRADICSASADDHPARGVPARMETDGNNPSPGQPAE